MKIFTIGFTRKPADKFFSILCRAGISRIIDIRLNNASQLAGFTKKDDLSYFLKEICDIDYLHKPELVPTKEIFDAYTKNSIDWDEFKSKFIGLMEERKVEKTLSQDLFDDACLLCSEEKPEKCHRGLVADYLKAKWPGIEVVHLI